MGTQEARQSGVHMGPCGGEVARGSRGQAEPRERRGNSGVVSASPDRQEAYRDRQGRRRRPPQEEARGGFRGDCQPVFCPAAGHPSASPGRMGVGHANPGYPDVHARGARAEMDQSGEVRGTGRGSADVLGAARSVRRADGATPHAHHYESDTRLDAKRNPLEFLRLSAAQSASLCPAWAQYGAQPYVSREV